MKSAKEFLRTRDEDSIRKAAKLDPMRRSGKERHQLFKSLSSASDQDDDLDHDLLPKRESALDYFDDENDEQNDEQNE